MGSDNDLGDLSALSGDGFPGDDLPTEDELAEHGKEALWLSDEMPPPENVAYSLRRIDAALGEILEISERSVSAQERIAAALEAALLAFAK